VLEQRHFENQTDADVEDGLVQLHALECAVKGQLLGFIVEYDRRETYESDGASSMEDWLCYRLGIDKRRGAEMVAVAHALEGLPILAAAVESGLVSWDKLVVAIEVAGIDGDAKAAAMAREWSLPALKLMARRTRRVARAAAEAQHRARSLRWWWEGSDTVRLWGRLPADQGAVVIKALGRIAERAAPGPDGFYDAYECRAADALADVCGAAIGADPDPDKATVVVHVDAGVLAGDDGVAEIEDGPQIAAAVAGKLACGARIQVMSHGPGGEIVGVGRMRRTPSPWLRRHVKHRDKGCVFPGCSRTLFLRPHHIAFWGRGGPTDADNLVMLCSAHHALVHEGGWSISGRPSGRLRFMKPDGSEFASPARLRDDIRDRVLGHHRE
jgi:Domain of unknown function (DUF222)